MALGELAVSTPEELTLEEVCARLFAEPLRRFSPRTSVELLSRVDAALKAADKGAKKAKGGGKKGKAADANAVPMCSLEKLRESVARADAPAVRPTSEIEQVAARCFAAARSAHFAKGEAVALQPEDAPMEAVLEALRGCLLQPTTERAEAPPPSPSAGG